MSKTKYLVLTLTLVMLGLVICLVNLNYVSFGQKIKPESDIETQVTHVKDSSPESVVLSYCELARNGNFSELKLLLVQTPDWYLEDGLRKWREKYPSNDHVKNTSQGKIAVKSPGSEPTKQMYYEDISEMMPKFLFNTQLFPEQILKVDTANNKSRVRVRFKQENRRTYIREWDFFLHKGEDEKWKIFLRRTAEQGEADPF